MILPLWLNGLFRFIVNHIENLVKQTDGYNRFFADLSLFPASSLAERFIYSF